jgi:hypothetical protein
VHRKKKVGSASRRDAKQVVTQVNAAGLNLSAASQFVIGIQEELQGLRHATMVYVGIESNKEAYSRVTDMVWLEDIPNFILQDVLRDSYYAINFFFSMKDVDVKFQMQHVSALGAPGPRTIRPEA